MLGAQSRSERVGAMSLLLAAAIAQAALVRSRIDHTDDIAVVARFLSNVRARRSESDSVAVENREVTGSTTFATFAAYANACNISRVYAIPSATRRLPIAAEWDCGRFTKIAGKPVWEERVAEFWVENGRVVRVKYGRVPTIPIRAPDAKSLD